jgi:hypothetical protein
VLQLVLDPGPHPYQMMAMDQQLSQVPFGLLSAPRSWENGSPPSISVSAPPIDGHASACALPASLSQRIPDPHLVLATCQQTSRPHQEQLDVTVGDVTVGKDGQSGLERNDISSR